MTLTRYAQLFDLGAVGEQLGYPLFMKPYDGGGWAGVSRIDDEAGLRAAYEGSGTYVMHLQQAVDPHDLFVRCIGFGPQTRIVRYDPSAPLHDRYTADDGGISDDERSLLSDITLPINSFFGWDFNSCEALRQNGEWYPIDFANACPDSQVTSLHYHFPWLVAANLRWSIFCAATKRPMRRTLDWEPYFEVARRGPSVPRAARGLRARSPASASTPTSSTTSAPPTSPTSTRSCGSSSATPVAKDAVRQKVAALFPPHEVDAFTELFWNRIQTWRADNSAEPGMQRQCVKERTHVVLERGRARRQARPLGLLRHASARVPDRRRRRRGDRTIPPRRRRRRAARRRSREGLLARQRQRTCAVGAGGRRRAASVDPAEPVPRVRPLRGRPGDPRRLRVTRHRDHHVRCLDRRVQRARPCCAAGPTCSAPRSA